MSRFDAFRAIAVALSVALVSTPFPRSFPADKVELVRWLAGIVIAIFAAEAVHKNATGAEAAKSTDTAVKNAADMQAAETFVERGQKS